MPKRGWKKEQEYQWRLEEEEGKFSPAAFCSIMPNIQRETTINNTRPASRRVCASPIRSGHKAHYDPDKQRVSEGMRDSRSRFRDVVKLL